jgi:transketolase
MADSDFRRELGQQLRVDSVRASAAAGSGHPTSSMSAADLIAVLLDGYLTLDFQRPDDPRNDHLIFSKGHASPLYYAMLKAVGAITDEELLITVEDHWPQGGLGEAVLSALATHPRRPPIRVLAVDAMPVSGKPAELLHAAGIDAAAITAAARQLLNEHSITSAS